MYNINLNNKPPVSFSASPKHLITKTIEYMPRKEFVDKMRVLQKVDEKIYNRLIESVETYSEKLKKKINVREIMRNGAPEIKNIPIGRGGIALFVKRFKNFLMMPVKAVQFLFVRMKNLLLNPGKTFKSLTKSFDKKHHLDAKKALKDVQPKKLTPIFTKNALELIEKSSKELGIPVEKVVEKLGKDPVITRKFKETYGEHLADLLSDEKASYDGATASTWFKMTALITIPLKVIDAYNVSQSKDGDTSMSAQKAKERLGQDLTRHGLSTWITAGFNTIFREVSNRSILGASVVAGTQTIVSEVLTRVVAGVAVLPKTRDQLIDMEDKTLNAKGLKGAYYRFMSGVTGRKPLRELTKNHNNGSKQDKDNLDDELPTDMFTTKSHKQYSPSADKLYIDSAFARLKNSQN